MCNMYKLLILFILNYFLERLNVDYVVVLVGSEFIGRVSMKLSGVLVVLEGVKRGIWNFNEWMRFRICICIYIFWC